MGNDSEQVHLHSTSQSVSHQPVNSTAKAQLFSTAIQSPQQLSSLCISAFSLIFCEHGDLSTSSPCVYIPVGSFADKDTHSDTHRGVFASSHSIGHEHDYANYDDEEEVYKRHNFDHSWTLRVVFKDLEHMKIFQLALPTPENEQHDPQFNHDSMFFSKASKESLGLAMLLEASASINNWFIKYHKTRQLEISRHNTATITGMSMQISSIMHNISKRMHPC